MADPYVSLGKNLHSIHNGGQLSPSAVQTPKAPSDLTFQNVLNRTKLTSAQLQALEPPTYRPSAPMASNLAAARPAARTADAVSDSSASLPSLAAETNEEYLKYIPYMPADIPQGEEFEKRVLNDLNNYMAYRKAKAEEIQSNSLNAPSLSPRKGGAFGLIPKSAPVQTAGALNAPDVSASSFNSVFSKTPEPVDSGISTSYWDDKQKEDSASPSMTEETKKTVKSRSRTRAGFGRVNARKTKTEKSVESNAAADKSAETITEKKPGGFDAVFSFFKDVASGVTLGFYQPEGDKAPAGVGRILYPFKKLLIDAPIKDLAIGVPVGLARTAGSAFHKEKESANEAQQDQAETKSVRRRSAGVGSKPWLLSRTDRF
ncbi:MAG: hypothetical protein AB1656_19180 [Candidatus Omnitrophota bacterium]